jgi:hypothetical protein
VAVHGILDALSVVRFEWDERVFTVGASIGVADLDR